MSLFLECSACLKRGKKWSLYCEYCGSKRELKSNTLVKCKSIFYAKKHIKRNRKISKKKYKFFNEIKINESIFFVGHNED